MLAVTVASVGLLVGPVPPAYHQPAASAQLAPIAARSPSVFPSSLVLGSSLIDDEAEEYMQIRAQQNARREAYEKAVAEQEARAAAEAERARLEEQNREERRLASIEAAKKRAEEQAARRAEVCPSHPPHASARSLTPPHRTLARRCKRPEARTGTPSSHPKPPAKRSRLSTCVPSASPPVPRPARRHPSCSTTSGSEPALRRARRRVGGCVQRWCVRDRRHGSDPKLSNVQM